MTGIIYKFPYNVSRRAYSRMGRVSKNGAPEERAAKAAVVRPDPSTAANVVQLSRKPVAPFTPPTAEETARFMALYNQIGPADQALICDVLRGMVNNQSPQ
jgi:hypothetical protein